MATHGMKEQPCPLFYLLSALLSGWLAKSLGRLLVPFPSSLFRFFVFRFSFFVCL
jgi:hypothetical protein